MTEPPTDTATEELHVRRDGRAGRITLNRPKALNALAYPQIAQIASALEQWQADPAVELVILDGAGGRALCAGGDVKAMYDGAKQGNVFARRFWSDEYRLNSMISRYPKPFVALMDGIVMGGGIGLSAHASHRVVTEKSQLAMPETTIGLIPDVGGTWLLGHAPGSTGEYLGLLGVRMNAADAIYARFADAHITSDRLPELIGRLAEPGPTPGPTPGAIIRAMATDAGPSTLALRRARLDALFEASTVEGIRDAMTNAPEDWAQTDVRNLASRSPLALKLTLAAVRAARHLPALERALETEYRLCVRLYDSGEFLEGVRALIVDKDRSPKWNPPRLEEVTEDLVVSYFAPLPPGEDLHL